MVTARRKRDPPCSLNMLKAYGNLPVQCPVKATA